MRLPDAHRDRANIDVKMTPMIDVVFLLLIFFVCTASFQIAEALLPAALSTAGSSPAELEIEIDPDLERIVVKGYAAAAGTTWIVNEKPCPTWTDVRNVLAAVAQIDRSLPVILDVADEVSLGEMIDVYDLCRLVGFDRIQFAADRKS